MTVYKDITSSTVEQMVGAEFGSKSGLEDGLKLKRGWQITATADKKP